MSSTSARSGAPTSRSATGNRSASRSGPKSHKSDGSRKQRWTAAERSDRGRPARRSAGRGELPGSDRGSWSTNRTDRTDRPGRSWSADRAGRTGADDRPSRSWSDDRTEPRSTRPSSADDRTDPRSGPARSTGKQRYDKPRYDKPRYDKPRSERDDRRPAKPRYDGRSDRRIGYDRPAPSGDPDQMTWNGDREVDGPTGSLAAPAVAADNGFAGLGLPSTVVRALAAGGITQPFPIQAATIGDALAGRDVLGRARTGSGKTLGFGLPMITRLVGSTASAHTARGIVLVPTRELALQVADVIAPLARAHGLSVTLVTGGMSYTPQLRAFERGVDIAVATPGRLIDLLEQGAADLSRVEVTVLDEADHMADLGFLPAVTQILDAVPAGGQRMLFSATLDRAVDRLVRMYLVDPVTHEVDPGQASITTMSHHLVHVQPSDKTAVTAEIASRSGRTIAFVRTQLGGDRIAEQLRAAGVLAGALHGGLTQGARARILAAFKDGRLPVLVATDVAARGIHVDEVGLVLQVDPPNGPKDYLHRAGRTARAGEDGVVVSLVLPHQRRDMQRLTHQAGVSAEAVAAQPGDAELAQLTGARPGGATAVTRAEFDAIVAPPVRSARRRPEGGRPRRGDARRGDGRRRDRSR